MFICAVLLLFGVALLIVDLWACDPIGNSNLNSLLASFKSILPVNNSDSKLISWLYGKIYFVYAVLLCPFGDEDAWTDFDKEDLALFCKNLLNLSCVEAWTGVSPYPLNFVNFIVWIEILLDVSF